MTTGHPNSPWGSLRVRSTETTVLLVTSLALLLVWAPKLLPIFYSFDDYALVFDQRTDVSLRFLIGDGRFLEAALWWLLVQLGADPPRAVTLLNAGAILLFAGASVQVVRFWRM